MGSSVCPRTRCARSLFAGNRKKGRMCFHGDQKRKFEPGPRLARSLDVIWLVTFELQIHNPAAC